LSAFFSISAHGYAISHPFWLDRSYERMTAYSATAYSEDIMVNNPVGGALGVISGLPSSQNSKGLGRVAAGNVHWPDVNS
jgi:hypothetical protein